MDWVYALQATILGVVEGMTEFLPVSSTGHLIIASDLIDFSKTPGADTFVVAIQAGAILAVCWYYRLRIMAILRELFTPGKQQRLAVNTVVAFLPAAFFGVLLAGWLKAYLFNAVTVATALIVGGVVILWVEGRNQRQAAVPRVVSMDDMTWRDALAVGLAQCFAMIPGTSRSGATIIGGMLLGLSRKAATEFSFFLAIPTIFGATVYDLYASRAQLLSGALSVPGLLVGTVISFFSALVVVHWLIAYVSKHDFRPFGWYRIAFGLFILLTWFTGWVHY